MTLNFDKVSVKTLKLVPHWPELPYSHTWLKGGLGNLAFQLAHRYPKLFTLRGKYFILKGGPKKLKFIY